MEIKTTKQIISDSFKNQEFNQKATYPEVTNVFDELEWVEENDFKWVSVDDIRKALIKISEDELVLNPPVIAINELIEELSKVKEIEKMKRWK